MKEVFMKKNIATIFYSEAFAMYWCIYCVISSFASVYLLEKGYTNTGIGILLAAANIVSVIIQPLAANLSDRSRRITVIDVIIIMAVLIGAFELLTLVTKGRSLLMFAAYVLMLAFHAGTQPLLNSISMKLARCGISADYGISRGIGSLGYSLMSIAMGSVVAAFGAKLLPLVGVLCVLLLLPGMLGLRYIYRHPESCKSGAAASETVLESKEITMRKFVTGHRLFMAISAGIFILFYHQQIINFFMLQIFSAVGGDSTDMGLYFSIMSFLEIPALIGFSRLNKRFSTVFLLKLGVTGLVLRGLLMYLAASPLSMQLSLIVHPIGFPLFLGAIVKYINEIMDEGEAVRGQSMYVIVITLSAIAASFTGGILLDSVGSRYMLLICLLLCVIGAAIVLPLIDKAANEKNHP